MSFFISPKTFQTIYFIIYKDIAFCVKSLKFALYKNGRWRQSYMCCHNGRAKGNHPCMFLNSSIKSLREVDEYLKQQTILLENY